MEGIIDIHCHLLYGVDDGVKTLEESKKIFEEQVSLGVRGMILTPHYRRGMFETSQEKIAEHYLQIEQAAREVGMTVFHGCEYHASHDMVGDFRKGFRWTLADSDYALTEYSTISDYRFLRETTYQMLSNGYIPVIAHIERYNCLFEEWDRLDELLDMGAMLQVNADAVLGVDGRAVKKFCKVLLKEEMIDFIASDCHGLNKRPSHLAKCYQYVQKKFGKDEAERIFIDNPMEIINSKKL